MDLFRHSADRDRVGQPLAERMRPRELNEFVGQSHLLGPDRLLSVAPGGGLPSLILWGPPGTGKTTLASILARRAGARLVAMSAAQSGVKELRETVAEADRARSEARQKTVLFLDEIHRFNKAQQDSLLPHVEAGTITLIGATTENPSFEVNAALLSRCKVVRLEALDESAITQLLGRALGDEKRGLGTMKLRCAAETCALIAQQSSGDARRALSTLEIAAELATRSQSDEITASTVHEALQTKTLLYDKAGDEHYNLVSAFIKSMRGSDPDAAVYWLVRMLEAGEDPIFLMRRMVIFSSEDIGNADPRALTVAISALDSVRLIGLPEGTLPMTQAAIYLATAPKSNSVLTTYAAARRAVTEHGALPVPIHIRNAPTKLMKEFGYGSGYQYPHDFEGHPVAERYLPDKIGGEKFYAPSDAGYEQEITARLSLWRKQSSNNGQT